MIKIVCPVFRISEVKNFLESLAVDARRLIVVFKENDDQLLFKQVSNLGAKVIQQDASGIYNAINVAVKALRENEFYIVMGSDDIVSVQALQICESLNLSPANVYTGAIKIAGVPVRRKKSYLLHGHKALVSEHAVGCLLNKFLHDQFGFYLENQSIASDADFLMRLHRQKVNFYQLDIFFGEYGGNGISTKRYYKGQLELILSVLRVHEFHKGLIMSMLIILRIIKNAFTR